MVSACVPPDRDRHTGLVAIASSTASSGRRGCDGSGAAPRAFSFHAGRQDEARDRLGTHPYSLHKVEITSQPIDDLTLSFRLQAGIIQMNDKQRQPGQLLVADARIWEGAMDRHARFEQGIGSLYDAAAEPDGSDRDR
jgi:hypothetical protein